MPSLTEAQHDRLLREALPLIATFAHRKTVLLGPLPVGAGPEEESDLAHFLATVRARHALGCAQRLQDVLPEVERAFSSESRSTHVVSRGAVRGRVDVPAYVRARSRHAGPVRDLPLIVTESFPQTPENRLGTWLLSSLRQALSEAAWPVGAEREAGRRARVWLAARLLDAPWGEVDPGPVPRLRREAEHRIRRRRTGNESGYRELTEVIDDWVLDPESLGKESLDQLLKGLLAFPLRESFRDHVFEVWCLRQARRALKRLGFEDEGLAKPLSARRGEVFRLEREGEAASVWFRRQRPLGTAAWRYDDGGALKGIPDVVVQVGDRPPFVIDAKLRWVEKGTRSEETYKMLGYAHNFPGAAGSGFFGALVFVGPKSREVRLSGPDGGKLALLVHDGKEPEALVALLTERLRDWLQLSPEQGQGAD